jgi:hypothetical protein
MSNGADRFFDEMLVSAKTSAKKEVAKETATLKSTIRSLRKEVITAEAGIKGVTAREGALKKATQALAAREKNVTLAEKEIQYLMDQHDELLTGKVQTTTTTKIVKSLVKGSVSYDSWYGRTRTLKAKALSKIRKRGIRKVK